MSSRTSQWLELQPNRLGHDGTRWDESLSATPKTALFLDSLVQDDTMG